MAASTTPRVATRMKCNAADRYRDVVVDTAETLYPGCFAGLRAGKLCNADLDTDYVCAGVVGGKTYDPGAGATAIALDLARVHDGVFGPFAQEGATITVAHVGRRAYLADNQTLTLATTSGARCAGIITDVTSAGVYVETGLAICAMLDSAPRIQQGGGTLISGVLAVSDVQLSTSSRIDVRRITEGGTDGDELRVPIADVVIGEAGSFSIRSFLNGSVATSDTSTVSWTVIG